MPARVVLTGPQRTALAGDVNVYVRILVRRADLTWIDLSNYLGTDWFVKGELRSTIDDPVASATITLLREDGAGVSLAPQMSLSAANRDGGGFYNPLISAGNLLRVLTATVAQGAGQPADGAADWKRVFDGKIDSTDPGGDQGTMQVVARDRGAWLQDTFIETKRTYGLLAGVAIESVMASIIGDNAVPGAPTISTPTSPGWMLQPYEQDQVQTLQALRDLVLQIGWDLRYLFLADGDVDPTLLFYQPPRGTLTADWTFGPNEYLEIPSAKLDDADIRNAVTINFRFADGTRSAVTRINSASITQFGRRWMQITESDTSNIDTTAEANTMGDALVADLGEPAFTQQVRTVYFWPINLNDVVQLLANNVHYDQAQTLAVAGITHSFENGHGDTVLDCRGAPAGAYHEWLALAGNPGAGGNKLVLRSEVLSQDATSITLKLTATAPGSSRQPAVVLLWTGASPAVSKLSGGDVNVFVPNGSTWTFVKPNPGTGASLVAFSASLSGFQDADVLSVVIPEGTAFGTASIDTPVISVNPDPANEFIVDWTPHAAPTGAKYRLYWRISTGSPWTLDDYTVVGTANTYTIGPSEHHQTVNTGPPTNSIIQVYVEMYTTAGDYLCQSAVGEANWDSPLGGG